MYNKRVKKNVSYSLVIFFLHSNETDVVLQKNLDGAIVSESQDIANHSPVDNAESQVFKDNNELNLAAHVDVGHVDSEHQIGDSFERGLTNVMGSNDDFDKTNNHDEMKLFDKKIDVNVAPVNEQKIDTQENRSGSELDKQSEVSADDQIVGLDTVSLKEPKGNWLFKKIWWERAQEQYEKVRNFITQIMDYRMQFFMQRAEIDRLVLDPFYNQIGVAQGRLDEIIDIWLAKLEHERNIQGALELAERKIENNVTATKESLERLKIDLKMVANIDHMIDEALEQLVQQINKVKSYEQEAWQSYKQIGFELSDAKARELFYHLDMHMRYIKDIQRYLQFDFARHFQELTRQVSTETERLLGVVNRLKEQGIDLKKQFINDADNARLNDHKIEDVSEVLNNDDQVEVVVEHGNFFGKLYKNIMNGFEFFAKKLSSFFKFNNNA